MGNNRFIAALEVFLEIAKYKADGEYMFVSLSVVSERVGWSVSYLESLVKELVAAGVLKAKRGPSGGYAATDFSETLTVFELRAILQAIPTRKSQTHKYFEMIKRAEDDIEMLDLIEELEND